MYKAGEDSPAKDYTKKPLPGTTAKNPPAPKTPHAKPRQEGESDEAYNKRTENWQKSQDRLKSVGITGGVNKASDAQLKAFSDKYGHGPSGLKPKEDKSKEPKDTGSTTTPEMTAKNPSQRKEPKLPMGFNKNAINMKAPVSTTSRDKTNKNITADAAEKAMSSIPGMARKARRKKRLMKKTAMAGGTY